MHKKPQKIKIMRKTGGRVAASARSQKRPSREEIREVIAQMKAGRSILNPPGKEKLKIKELINEGRR